VLLHVETDWEPLRLLVLDAYLVVLIGDVMEIGHGRAFGARRIPSVVGRARCPP
jgi:hypothetical protein